MYVAAFAFDRDNLSRYTLVILFVVNDGFDIETKFGNLLISVDFCEGFG